MGFGSTAYTGLAAYGRFQAVTGAVVAVLIMLVMWYVGVQILSSHKKTVRGTVVKSQMLGSERVGSDGTVLYHLKLSVRYSFDGGDYSTDINSSSSSRYFAGDSISLQVDPRFPEQPDVSSVPHWAGAALLVGGLAIGMFGVGTAYLSLKSKEFAAVSGTASFVHQLRA